MVGVGDVKVVGVMGIDGVEDGNTIVVRLVGAGVVAVLIGEVIMGYVYTGAVYAGALYRLTPEGMVKSPAVTSKVMFFKVTV